MTAQIAQLGDIDPQHAQLTASLTTMMDVMRQYAPYHPLVRDAVSRPWLLLFKCAPKILNRPQVEAVGDYLPRSPRANEGFLLLVGNCPFPAIAIAC